MEWLGEDTVIGDKEVRAWAERTMQATVDDTNKALKNLLKGFQPLHLFQIRKMECGFFEWIFHMTSIREAYRFRKWAFNRPLGLNEGSRLKVDIPLAPEKMRLSIFVPCSMLEDDREIADSLSIMNPIRGVVELDETYTSMERAWENLNLSASAKAFGSPVQRPRVVAVRADSQGVQDIIKIYKEAEKETVQRDKHYCIRTFTNSVHIKFNETTAGRYVETCAADKEFMRALRARAQPEQTQRGEKEKTETNEKEAKGKKEAPAVRGRGAK